MAKSKNKTNLFNSALDWKENNYQESTHDGATIAKAFESIVSSRRSVRVFTKDPIPKEIVEKCLDAALLAPNSSNLQPWEFYWVRSKLKKKKLVEACLSQPAAKTAQELIVCVARTKTWKKNAKQMITILEKNKKAPKGALDYYKKLVPLAYNQGPFGAAGFLKKISVTAVGFSKPIPREPTSEAQMETWAVKSSALACENLMLAFRAYGFDSCPMEGMDSTRVKKLLKLKSDAVVTMVVSAGKRANGGVYGPRVRFDKKQFIHIV